jgi:hypothetical protein
MRKSCHQPGNLWKGADMGRRSCRAADRRHVRPGTSLVTSAPARNRLMTRFPPEVGRSQVLHQLAVSTGLSNRQKRKQVGSFCSYLKEVRKYLRAYWKETGKGRPSGPTEETGPAEPNSAFGFAGNAPLFGER